jgi:hypothetical protein
MLRGDSSVVDALRTLVDKAWTEEARKCGEGAIMALFPQEVVQPEVDRDSLHIMMSYQVRSPLNR